MKLIETVGTDKLTSIRLVSMDRLVQSLANSLTAEV